MSVSPLVPRPVTTADHDWLFGLHDDAHRALVEEAYGPWDDAQQREFFAPLLNDFEVWVFEQDGDPVAALYLGERDGDVWIELVEVLPARQGEGIGSVVLGWTVDRAVEQGVGVLLQVHRVNADARRLYLREGFVEVGTTETHHLLRRPAS